jgi:hypothetical protein
MTLQNGHVFTPKEAEAKVGDIISESQLIDPL